MYGCEAEHVIVWPTVFWAGEHPPYDSRLAPGRRRSSPHCGKQTRIKIHIYVLIAFTHPSEPQSQDDTGMQKKQDEFWKREVVSTVEHYQWRTTYWALFFEKMLDTLKRTANLLWKALVASAINQNRSPSSGWWKLLRQLDQAKAWCVMWSACKQVIRKLRPSAEKFFTSSVLQLSGSRL